jgi:hypothetical protein
LSTELHANPTDELHPAVATTDTLERETAFHEDEGLAVLRGVLLRERIWRQREGL